MLLIQKNNIKVIFLISKDFKKLIMKIKRANNNNNNNNKQKINHQVFKEQNLFNKL